MAFTSRWQRAEHGPARACYAYGVSVPRALLLVLALLHATGITEVMRRATCEEECKRDGCDDDCTPGQEAPRCLCHCPSAPTATPPAVAVQTIGLPVQATAITFERAEQRYPSPDPREISHVPREHAV
jgi:hypothetical protein